MIIKFHVDRLWLIPICPVKVAGFKWVRFKKALLLAVSLDYLECLMSLVNDHVSRLKLNDLREAKGIRQVVYVGNYLVHAVRAIFSTAVLQEDRLALELGDVERKLSPVRVADLHADAPDIVLDVPRDVLEELLLVVLADALDILLPLLPVDQELLALVLGTV